MTMICCIISESVIFIRVILDVIHTSTYLIGSLLTLKNYELCFFKQYAEGLNQADV